MAGRVAFVTGGGDGIGGAICRQLAAAGHHVVVADVSADAAQTVADEVEGTAVEVDVTDPASCEAAVRGVAEGLAPVQGAGELRRLGRAEVVPGQR